MAVKAIGVFYFISVKQNSFSFAVIALSINESMDKSNEEYRYDTYGIWQAALLNGNKEDF